MTHLRSLCFALLSVVIVASSSTSLPQTQKIVVGVDGGTESIRACCFDATTGHVVGKSCAVPYPTHRPHPGWAEQDPADWYQNLGEAVRSAVSSIDDKKNDVQICAICLDTTCCSVVVLDQHKEPLRPSLLWMDARSAPQTQQIMEQARGDPALRVNCGGEGPLSAEWMTPKALWVQQNEPSIWEKTKHVCEYQDYLNYRLTGTLCASSCNAATRWHWDGQECIVPDTSSDNDNDTEASPESRHRGRPLSLYRTVGIPELADKLPQRCLPMGAIVGGLTKEAAEHLNLPEGLPVAQGGPDAFVGMVGLGCVHPGQLCLITGSSHLHCVVTSTPTTAVGTWGAYRGAPLPGINFAEGGQSSTGSILQWAKQLLHVDDYQTLDDEAAVLPPGAEGLVALETFQGSRTPVTDPLARGGLLGLTLSHTRGHIWRALMEAVCFGTRACIQGLDAAGHGCDEIVLAGGIARSPLWLQMHADVTGKPVVVCENADAPLLGCAILASVAVGIHETAEAAVMAMVRTKVRIEPNPAVATEYTKLFQEVYSKVSTSIRPVVHSIAALRGGSQSSKAPTKQNRVCSTHGPVISPSLLAADWSIMRDEVQRCIMDGANHLHVDVFDGVFLDSPKALTFGPQMVHAIRRSAQKQAILDLHMCVERPGRYVEPMKEAGADRFIFQWEAIRTSSSTSLSASVLEATRLAKEIIDADMYCGISINPETPIDEIYPLLQTGLVDVVDILAVAPGFGGQSFQEHVLDKIRQLRSFRTTNGLTFQILVDGGINEKTGPRVLDAGADVLVAGTFLFRHPKGIREASRQILAKSRARLDAQ